MKRLKKGTYPTEKLPQSSINVTSTSNMDRGSRLQTRIKMKEEMQFPIDIEVEAAECVNLGERHDLTVEEMDGFSEHNGC